MRAENTISRDDPMASGMKRLVIVLVLLLGVLTWTTDGVLSDSSIPRGIEGGPCGGIGNRYTTAAFRYYPNGNRL